MCSIFREVEIWIMTQFANYMDMWTLHPLSSSNKSLVLWRWKIIMWSNANVFWLWLCLGLCLWLCSWLCLWLCWWLRLWYLWLCLGSCLCDCVFVKPDLEKTAANLRISRSQLSRNWGNQESFFFFFFFTNFHHKKIQDSSNCFLIVFFLRNQECHLPKNSANWLSCLNPLSPKTQYVGEK